MTNLHDYSKMHPLMPIEIYLFFRMESKNNTIVTKYVYEFCSYYKEKYSTSEFPQPRIVARMCDILAENGHLSIMQKGGMDNAHNSYMCIIKDQTILENNFLQSHYNKKLSYIIYGFKFILEDYQKYVLPVQFTDKNEDIFLGTCFLYFNGIATAKHCIKDAKKIAIPGILPEDLKHAEFEIHQNDLMDLLFIRFKNPIAETIIFNQNAEVLDEVMTLGYPRIPGYHNFLTSERATVSSRFTGSLGQVSANAEDIWIKEKLYLITAKIKGGNSGGPVLTKDGSVIGVAVNLAEGDGNYDELGYGTVIPISFLNELIGSTDKRYLDTSKIDFTSFDKQ